MSQVFTVGGTDYTDVLDKLSPEIGGKADYGNSSVGAATLFDDENVIDDDDVVRIWKQYSWVETATTPDTVLSAGRITGWASRRGESEEDSIMDNEVQLDLQLEDANAELAKLDFYASKGGCNSQGRWVRPEETDVERVQALAADFLNGDPRATTVLDASTYVPNENTVTMEAKTYQAGTKVIDVLMECATAADKWYFVTADQELWYDVPDSETYDASLEISDGVGTHPAVDNITYWAPIWDMGPALDFQGQEFATALVGLYGADQAVFEEDTDLTAAYDWLSESITTDAETAGQAAHQVHGTLRIRGRGMRAYQVTLRLKNTEVDKIKYGQRVRLHVSAAVDMDDTPQYRRVAELKWQPVGDGSWYDAHLTLERMPRIFPGNINGGPTRPKPPDTGTPGTPPTAPTELVRWSFTNLGGTSAANLYDDATHSTYRWNGPTWEDNAAPAAWHAGFGSAHITWGGAGAGTIPNLPGISAGDLVTVSWRASQRQADSSARMYIYWYNSGGTFLSATLLQLGFSVASVSSYTKVATAPTGATHLALHVSAAAGEFGAADDIVVSVGGSAGTAGTPSTSPTTTVGLPGDGQYSDSGEYVPVGSILELSQDAVDQLVSDAAPTVADSTVSVDPTYTLRLPDGGVDDAGGGEARLRVLLSRGGGRDLLATNTGAGSAADLDLSIANVYDLTLDDDCTLSFSNPPAADLRGRWTIILRQDASGSHAVTWPAEVVWRDTDGTPTATAPALATAAGAVDVVILTTLDGGASYGAALDNGNDGGSGVTLSDATPLVESGAGSAGTGTEASRDDHVHPAASSGTGIGPILISDTPSTPLVFGDLIQNEAQDDLVYADT